jgi:hypothetical protein
MKRDQPALPSIVQAISLGILCLSRDALNERRLAVGVANTVVWVRGGQLNFEAFVGTGGPWMCNEMVTEKKALPVLQEGPPPRYHVDVVCSDAPVVAPDEKSIPRGHVISEAGAPKVIVALSH